MTYTELSQIKTSSMTLNCIIDDMVNNARWGYTKAAYKKAAVSEYDMQKIKEWATREGIDEFIDSILKGGALGFFQVVNL